MKIAYLRTSTSSQEPLLQERNIGTMVAVETLEIMLEKQSAFKENVKRPVFDNLRKLIAAGKVEELYVWHLDRVYRNRKKLVAFLTFCKVYNTKVYSYNQPWLVTIQKMPEPFNQIIYDLMLNVIGWSAESESETRSNRVLNSVRRTEDGTYSYKGNRWGRKPFPKQTIDRVLEMHRAGLSIREISKSVNVYDKNNNAKPISKSSVHNIITDFSTVKV